MLEKQLESSCYSSTCLLWKSKKTFSKMLSPVTVTTQKSKAQQWSRHAASFHTYFNNKNGYHTHFWGENNNIFGKRNEKLTNNLA